MMDGKHLRYRFDEVEIDVANLRVMVGGEVRALEPKSFRLLVFLVENRGRALGKDEIMGAVWPDAAVSDNSLARAITQVRKTLDDDPKSPRYIETVPTVGYRFVGDCKVEGQDKIRQALTGAGGLWRQARGHARGWRQGCFFTFVAGHPQAGYPLRVASVSKLTSYVGDEREPAVSPDGSLVAFSWSGVVGDNDDIYVVKPGGGQLLRLTQDPVPDSFPA